MKQEKKRTEFEFVCTEEDLELFKICVPLGFVFIFLGALLRL